MTVKRKRLIIIAVCCFIYFFLFNHPFPLQDGSLSKQDASKAALNYFGLEESQTETAVTYGVDKNTIAYLQKEQLLSPYMDQHDPAYPLDYYRVEMIGPDSLRYEALVHQYEGTVAGWSKQLEDVHPADEETAREAADHYLRQQRPNDLEGAEVERRQLPSSVYAFYYKQEDERIGDAIRTAIVHVEGDTVTAYRSTFSPPEAFLAWLEQQDQRARLFTNMNFWTNAAMAAAALALAIRYRQYLRWSDGLVLLFIYVSIQTLQYFNMFPNYVSMITLRHAEWPIIAFELVYSFLINAIFALTVYFPYIGGRALLIREGQHRLLPQQETRAWRSELKTAVSKGYWFACIILALQTLIFQAAGAMFHIWWIPDPMLATDNMIWPALLPVSAWAAAIGEEIVYRLFAITVFRRLFGSTFAAVLVSSMLWGLGHTAYPVYPVYTRFVEVTIIGIVLGYIFIKFGFTVALFTHAAIDSILMGLEILGRGDALNITAGLAYMIIPAFVGWALAKWKKTIPYDRVPPEDPLPPGGLPPYLPQRFR